MLVEVHLNPIFDEIHGTGCDQLAMEIAERVGDAVEKLNNALKGMRDIFSRCGGFANMCQSILLLRCRVLLRRFEQTSKNAVQRPTRFVKTSGNP